MLRILNNFFRGIDMVVHPYSPNTVKAEADGSEFQDSQEPVLHRETLSEIRVCVRASACACMCIK